MSTILNRFRRVTGGRPKVPMKTRNTADACTDSCCFDNTAYASASPASSLRSNPNAAPMRPTIRRSDTFTLKNGPPDELPDHIKYATYRKKPAKVRPQIDTSTVERDVFESLYTRQPKAAVRQTVPAQSTPRPATNVVQVRPFHVDRPSDRSPIITRKPNGSSVIRITGSYDATAHKTPTPTYNTSPKKPIAAPRRSLAEPPKAQSLQEVRRSFRDKYLPVRGEQQVQYQPTWFVDVNDASNDRRSKTPVTPRTSSDREAYRSLTYMEFNEPQEPVRRRGVSRTDTFNVTRPSSAAADDDVERPRIATVRRRETFRVHEPKTIPQTPKGYYLNRYRQHVVEASPPKSRDPTPDRRMRPATKNIPVGIATPYYSYVDREASASPAPVRSKTNRSPSPPYRTARHSPSPPQRQQPQISTATYTRPKSRGKPGNQRSPSPPVPAPRSGKIAVEALRPPAQPVRDPNQTNLGFDRFYDPDYCVPKNQNLFGPLATANLRGASRTGAKKRTPSSERRHWY